MYTQLILFVKASLEVSYLKMQYMGVRRGSEECLLVLLHLLMTFTADSSAYYRIQPGVERREKG